MTGPVEAEHTYQSPVPTVKLRKTSLLERTGGEMDVVRRADPPRHLQLAVVLIGPEPRHWFERQRVGIVDQQSLGSVDALFDRVVPVFDAHHLVEAAIGPTGHITCGRDAGSREHRRIADDTVVDGEARSLEPLGVGDDTDADHDDVGLDDRTVGEYDTSDMAIVGFESIDTDTGAEVDAVLDVDIGHQRADLLPQDSTERRGHGIDHGDVETPPPTGGGDLCADEACTDDSDSHGPASSAARSSCV